MRIPILKYLAPSNHKVCLIIVLSKASMTAHTEQFWKITWAFEVRPYFSGVLAKKHATQVQQRPFRVKGRLAVESSHAHSAAHAWVLLKNHAASQLARGLIAELRHQADIRELSICNGRAHRTESQPSVTGLALTFPSRFKSCFDFSGRGRDV